MKARRIFYLVLLVVVAVSMAYSNSFDGKFVLDDTGRIIDSTLIRSLASASSTLTTRYMVDLTFAVDYALGGLNPAYYHFTNLLIHLLCTVVLFLLVRLLMLASGKSSARADWVSFCIALLWGVHPLTTSSVTYICQRYESMMSLFYLSAMFCLGAGLRAAGKKSWVWLTVSALSCFGGMLCKQVMITAPFVLLLMDATFFAGGVRAALRRRWPYYAALVACWFSLGWLIRLDAANHAALFGAYSAEHGILVYLLNQAPVLLYYLRLSFWPEGLMLDCAWQPVLKTVSLMPSVTIVGALFVTVAYGLYRWPKLFFAAACVFIVLSPTSSIIPIPDLAFEHRMYLPLACLIAAIVLSGSLAVKKRKIGVIAVMTVAILAGVLAGCTYRRNAGFAEPSTMWAGIIKRCPENFRIWSFLVAELLDQGKYSEAEASVRQMLARVDMASGDESGRFNIPSSSPDKYQVLGRSLLGRILMRQGREAEALHQFTRIVEEYPHYVMARHNRALAMLSLGHRVAAERELDEILRLHPGHKGAGMVKASLLVEAGQHKVAAKLFDAVLTRYPGCIPARVELSWLLSVSFDDATRDVQKALSLLDGIEGEIGMPNIRIYDVRAAAYATLGDFSRAVDLQSRAVDEAEEHYRDGDPRCVEMKSRLILYKASVPFRLESSSMRED